MAAAGHEADPAGEPDPVPHAVFSTGEVPPGERYAFWRDSIACIFEVDVPSEVREEGFHAEIDASMFGPIMLARTQSRRQRWARTPRLMARDGMDHFMVQLFERGSMGWQTSRGSFAMPEDGLVVFDLAREVETVSPRTSRTCH